MKKDKMGAFLCALIAFLYVGQAWAQSADSLRMVDFYNKANGSAWLKKKNWLSSDSAYRKWFGLRTNTATNRVTSIILPQNNLTGQITPEIKDCSELRTLNLAQNGIGGEIRWQIFNPPNIERIKLDSNFLTGKVPAQVLTAYNLRALYLSTNSLNDIPSAISAMPYLDTLDISNNFFTFDDIRYILGGGINVFKYLPQRRVGDLLNVNILKSQSYTLDAIVTDLGSTYQWFKDGSLIAGATNRTYTILDAKVSDAGTYSCNIKNPDVPLLTLQRNNIKINVDNSVDRVKDSLALVLFYNSTNGPNWTNKTNWLTGKLNTWYGVTISADNRVTELNLNNNNLEGNLPSAISEIEMLEVLNLAQNKLYGTITENIRELPKLKILDLSQNQFNGALPNLSTLTLLEYLDLSNNLLAGSLSTGFGSLDLLKNLRLNNNQFTDVTSAGLAGMAALERLNLANNHLVDLPKLKSISTLTELMVENNKLIFNDILPNIGITLYTYSPQANLDNTELVLAADGASLTFSVSLDSAQFDHKWFKNDKILPADTLATLNFPSAKEKDEGVYHVAISYPPVPGLVLLRNPITLFVNTSGERRQDSLALVALYNSTAGPAWRRSDNWVSARPLDEWFGLTMRSGRVATVNLANNNLRGALPNEIGNLSGCETFNLNRNVLTGFIPATVGNMTFLKNLLLAETKDPDFPNNETLGLRGEVPYALNQLKNLSVLDLSSNRLTATLDLHELDQIEEIKIRQNSFAVMILSNKLKALKILDVRENNLAVLPKLNGIPTMQMLLADQNRFTFEDLEYNVGIPIFTYDQQAKVSEREVIIVKPGLPYTFSCIVGGTANVYQWRKDGNPVSGKVNPTIGGSSADRSEQGVYECIVTNTIATNTALISEIKILFVVTPEDLRKDSLALVSLFNATNGLEWGVRWNWLSKGVPIAKWEGVKTNLAGRVTSIVLPSNELDGRIPPSIRDLEALEVLNLNGNKLGLNAALTDLQLLRDLRLRGSQIDSLVDFKKNAGLKNLDLSGNKLEFNDLEPFQSLAFMNYEKQDSVGIAYNLRPEVGKSYRLFMHTRGSDLSFRWFKNGIPLTDRFDSAFTLNFRSDADTGLYVCEAASPYFPKLKLYSRAFYISNFAVVSGLSDEILSQSIGLYPNPAKANSPLFFRVNSGALSLQSEVWIYTNTGQLHSQLSLGQDGSCTLPNISKGLFWLKIATTKGFVLKRLIIE